MTMATYSTPGVYVEEISTFPPSVAAVSTAIPAFIGYTASGPSASEAPKVVRINNLLEYETAFGGAKPTSFEVSANYDADNSAWSISSLQKASVASGKDFILYYCLSMYFKNGGGSCYIVSVGNYDDTASKQRFLDGIAELETEDEPTLISFPDAAVNLSASADYYDTCQAALSQCNKLGDRFTIIDVKENVGSEAPADVLRDASLNKSDLMYGAAYTPYLKTSLVYVTADDKVTLDITGYEVTSADAPADGEGEAAASAVVTLATVRDELTGLYAMVVKSLGNQRITLPPSSSIAGVYANVDRERGVWKAPANESIASVIGPVRKITDEEQGRLNIDVNAGKSINVIRAFTGRGTLVWGARTLAGNDNEWRYVSVRRLFNMIEESCQKSTAFAVFEPNDATTWLKVKAMIESFLLGLWEQGGLQGSTSESAYYVNVGLGKTMTSQDILEGRMNIEIGVAAVRPAEFVVLRFSHKLAEA